MQSVDDKEKKVKMSGWIEGKRHGQRQARVGGQEEKENEVKINEWEQERAKAGLIDKTDK